MSPSTSGPKATTQTTIGPKANNSGTATSKGVTIGKGIATNEFFEFDYNIFENMKKMETNIPIYEISKIMSQQYLLMTAWKDEKTSKDEEKERKSIW